MDLSEPGMTQGSRNHSGSMIESVLSAQCSRINSGIHDSPADPGWPIALWLTQWSNIDKKPLVFSQRFRIDSALQGWLNAQGLMQCSRIDVFRQGWVSALGLTQCSRIDQVLKRWLTTSALTQCSNITLLQDWLSALELYECCRIDTVLKEWLKAPESTKFFSIYTMIQDYRVLLN